jgi:hypothetical protein
MQTPGKIRVQKQRDFEPQHLLMRVAENALVDAENKIPGWKNQEIVAITFSALAIEALANSFGSKLKLCSDDFKSGSPVKKLEIICAELEITPDWSNGHWAAIWWLANLRNEIAHAEPQPLIPYDKILSSDRFHHFFHEELPSSTLENEMTLGNARRAVNAVAEIKWIFLSKNKCKQFSSLYSDGFSGMASAVV